MMKITLATLASLFLCIQITNIGAYTPFDARIHETCLRGQSLYRIRSFYSRHHRDRAWSFHCRYNNKVTSSCHWTGWLNVYDGELLYQCPNAGVIAGVYSIHHNHFEDRRFKFRCCRTVKKCRSHCYWTGNANSWNGYLNYAVPNGYFLAGAKSFHDNGKEDRIWRFLVCQ